MRYRFKPGWKISLGFLAVFVLFIDLGFWQLRRADEKTALLEAHERRSRDEPIRLSGKEIDPDAWRYRRVVAEGDYDPDHQFLLDNQVHEQRPGYQVLTPLRLSDGGAVLVNRGWVPSGADRSRRPDLKLRNTRVRILGTIDRFPRVGLKLKGAEIPGSGWPALVQLPLPERLAERLGYPLLAYQILLDPAAEEGYVRAWRVLRLDPEKNWGYALQWFLFAAMAAFLYLRHGFKAGSRTVQR